MYWHLWYAEGMSKSKSFADTIRRAIGRGGRTRYQISQESGVNQAVIGRFVHGERNLNLLTAERLCIVLGLELRAVKSKRRNAK